MALKGSDKIIMTAALPGRGVSFCLGGFLSSKSTSKKVSSVPCLPLAVFAAALLGLSGFAGFAGATASKAQVSFNVTQTAPMVTSWSPGDGSWSAVDLARELAGTEGVIYSAKIISAPPDGPRPNEKILVVMLFDSLGNYGRILGQVYDGASWGNAQILQTFVDAGGIAPLLRSPFDLAYESLTGLGVVVFSNGDNNDTTASAWATWDGAVWTLKGDMAVQTNTSGQYVHWVRLAANPKPNSQEIIALIGDNTAEGYALRWDGTAWGNSTNVTNNTILPQNFENGASYRSFDIAYSSKTSICYIFATGTNDDTIHTAYWSGAAFAARTDSADIVITAASWVWLEAKPDPSGNTDKIAVFGQTSGRAALGIFAANAWPNTWDTNSFANATRFMAYQPTLALEWYSDGSALLLAYVTANVTNPKYRTVIMPNTLGTEGNANNVGGSQINLLKLYRETGTAEVDNILLLASNDLGKLVSQRWTGAAWEGQQALNAYATYAANQYYDVSDNMAAYGGNDNRAGYRNLDPDTKGWDPANSYSMDIGGSPRYVKFQASPKRNEKTIVTLDNQGAIASQIWSGASFVSSQTITTTIDAIATNDFKRGFDFAYETKTGDALLVYSNNSTIPQYRTKLDGAAEWGVQMPITGWAGSGTPLWIRVEPNPDPASSEAMLVVMDSNFDLFGAVWDGTGFVSPLTFTTTLTGQLYAQNFDVAYTNEPHYKALVAWGDAAATTVPRYRIWYSTSDTWGAQQTAPDLDTGSTLDNAVWIKLASDRSNVATGGRIGMAVNDGEGDLTAMIFDGETEVWGSQLMNLETATVDPDASALYDYRQFDIAWEGGGGDMIVSYADGNWSLRHRVYRTGVGWGAEVGDDPCGGVPRSVSLYPDPNDPTTNELFAAVITHLGQVRVYHWSNPALQTTAFDTPWTPTLYDGYYWQNTARVEPIAMCYERDFLPPVAYIANPVVGGHYMALTQLDGTASDGAGYNVSGLKKVQLSIKDLTYPTTYYNEGTGLWVDNPGGYLWNDATDLSPWNTAGWGNIDGIWKTNHKYRVSARGIDMVGNVQTALTGLEVDVVYDTAPPRSGVTYPTDVSVVSAKSFLKINYANTYVVATGTSTDVDAGRIKNVVVRLQCAGSPTKPGQYWDWTTETWEATYREKVITPADTFNYNWQANISTKAFSEDQTTYYISVQIQDKAGNWQAEASTNTFVIDNTPPQTSVTWPDLDPDTEQFSPVTTLTGGTYDAFNIWSSSIAIRKGNSYWDGDGFDVPTPVWLNAAGTLNWTYPAVENNDNAQYRIYGRSMDYAGNIETTDMGAPDRTYIIDTSSPTSGLTAPGNNKWYSSLGAITGTARDGPEFGSIEKLYSVRIAVKRHSDGNYWQPGWDTGGPQWYYQDTPATPIKTVNANWSTSFTESNWGLVTGSSFTVYSKATDISKKSFAEPVVKLIEQSNPPLTFNLTAQATFYWDVTLPTSAVTSPAAAPADYVNLTGDFAGTFGDLGAGLGTSGLGGAGMVELLLVDKNTDGSPPWYYYSAFGSWETYPPVISVPPNPAVDTPWPMATNIYTSSWTWTHPTLIASHKYLLVSRVRDSAYPGNYQNDFTTTRASVTFTADDTEPDSGITAPNVAYLNGSALVYLYGTAADQPSPINIKYVDLEITQVGAPPTYIPAKIWGGAQWNDYTSPYNSSFSTFTRLANGGLGFTNTSLPNWVSTVPAGIGWQENTYYKIRARGTDVVNKVESDWTVDINERIFRYDVSWPTAAVVYPSSISVLSGNSYIRMDYSQPDFAISGTAVDTDPGLLQSVTLRLQCANSPTSGKTGKYWNWTTNQWDTLKTASNKTITAPDNNRNWNWSTTITTGAFIEDQTTYYMMVQPADQAGNQPPAFVSNTFVIDNTTPTTSISWPLTDNSQYSPVANIAGASDDAFNVRYASIAFQRGSLYWDGGSFGLSDPKWFNLGNGLSWQYPPPENADNTLYKVYTRVCDYAGNLETAVSPKRTYIVDTTSPTTVVVTPQQDQWYSALNNQLAGTARDGPLSPQSIEKLDNIQIAVRRLSDGNYWQPGWNTGVAWNSQSTPVGTINSTGTIWTYSISDADWGVSGSSYAVFGKGTDLNTPVNLVEQVNPPLGGTTFYWDVTPPTSTINFPMHLGVSGVNPLFHGTYYDKHSGLGPVVGGAVKIKLYAKTGVETGKLYYGGSWQTGTPAYSDLPDALIWESSWTYQLPISLETGASFLLVSVAKDRSVPGNYQSVFTIGESSNSFVVDNTKPNSSITWPITNFVNDLTQLAGNASDSPQSGQIARVELELVYPSDTPQWIWDNNAWVAYTVSFSTFVTATGGYPNWTYTVPALVKAESRQYRLRARSVDTSGNVETLFTNGVNERSFRFDISFPTSTLVNVVENSVSKPPSDIYFRDIAEVNGAMQDYPSPPDGSIGG
ncbi:MAG: hypothetical protein Q7R35_01940, partial [Elusimicrobiota bacterium]|nr:hypothetical protein [Elusimicrobiota bacterium]